MWQLEPVLPSQITLMCRGWRTETDAHSAACLWISRWLIATATVWFHVLEDLSCRRFTLLLRLTDTAVRAVEGSACKVAALSPAAHSLASPPVTVRWPWGQPAGRVQGAGCRGWGCGSAPAGVQTGGCCCDSSERRKAERRGNEGGEWPAWGRSEPGTLWEEPAPRSRWAAEAPEASPSPSSPLGLCSPPLSWIYSAAAGPGRPPASSRLEPGGYDTSSWSFGRSPRTHPGLRFPPWTSPAAPAKKGRQINRDEQAGRHTKGSRLEGNRSNKALFVQRFLISCRTFTHDATCQPQYFTVSRSFKAHS